MKYDRTVIAYHGCDASVARALLDGGSFKPSQNDYDWLGEGIYFWEYGYDRALRFAKEQHKRGKVGNPAVVGAILQLGNCFDLMDTKFTDELAVAFREFERLYEQMNWPLPQNRGRTPDKKLRRLDCAVLNFVLKSFEEKGRAFDSVRCAFVEGHPVFAGSGIHRETHVQIAIRNPACILGVFQPR